MEQQLKIEVSNLKRYFGKTKAVDDVTFSFESGHVFGFIGPNGAGKTTTLRIMATLDEPTDGDIYINGISVREEPEKVRRFVGYVPDSLPTHSDITVHEYLDFFGRAYGLKGIELTRAVEGVKEFTNVGSIQDKLIGSLSRGMKQRVSLGRSLIHDPSVLIMDEPAAALDPRGRVEFRELVRLLAEQGRAILISSHILTELTEICNGVVILERGKIVETGTLESVLERSMPRHNIVIRAIDRHEELYRALLEMPFIRDVRQSGNELEVEVDGTEESSAALLREIVTRGFQVADFHHQRVDLEDIFMQLTKGDVQ